MSVPGYPGCHESNLLHVLLFIFFFPLTSSIFTWCQTIYPKHPTPDSLQGPYSSPPRPYAWSQHPVVSINLQVNLSSSPAPLPIPLPLPYARLYHSSWTDDYPPITTCQHQALKGEPTSAQASYSVSYLNKSFPQLPRICRAGNPAPRRCPHYSLLQRGFKPGLSLLAVTTRMQHETLMLVSVGQRLRYLFSLLTMWPQASS